MSDDYITKYAAIWQDNPIGLMQQYDYAPELTKNLDNIDADLLNRELLYEIVLWKLNRFPKISESLIEQLKSVKNIKEKHHFEAKNILIDLLKCSGIALPMASTILRFINPNCFQIIDDRVFRILFPEKKKYPSKPIKITESYLKESVEIYFSYLDELHKVCSSQLPFNLADRILYQLDIKLGNKLGQKVQQ